LNADETALLEQYIDRGYKLFRKRVADGRKLSVEQVEEIAQGRVWLGNDALPIKLVDAVGSLDDAVKKAAELAKLKEYRATSYPEEEDWLSDLFNSVTKKSYLDEEMQAALGEYYEPLRFVKNLNSQSTIQARLPYIINIK
jgi:protease-4